jgi:hypothetical protein
MTAAGRRFSCKIWREFDIETNTEGYFPALVWIWVMSRTGLSIATHLAKVEVDRSLVIKRLVVVSRRELDNIVPPA